MNHENSSGGNVVVWLIGFVLVVATGFVLLITTLIMWLASLTGSPIAATLIVCGICLLLAGTIYLSALRTPIRRMQDKIETVYDVARVTKSGYEWATDKIDLFLKIRESWCEK